MSDPKAQREEVDRNYEAFKRKLPELLALHPGKFALMHGGEVIEIFDTLTDAMKYARVALGEKLFSVQEIKSQPADLGWFSHAMLDAAV